MKTCLARKTENTNANDMETINSLLKALDKVQGLSAVALVFLSCIVVGYVFRFIKSFPNEGIPVVVILWGALAMLVIADPRANDMPARIWTARNLFVGLIIGAGAWFSHKLLISRLEDFLMAKFNLGNTTFFKKDDTTPPVAPNPPKP